MTTCPQCGALLPENAQACPECGSDEKTGWSDKARFDDLGIPDDEFDHDEFVRREFGETKKSKIPRGIHWFWWLVAVGVLVWLVIGLLR